MSIRDVEQILGFGERIESNAIPIKPGGTKVVKGTEFLVWKDKAAEVIIGFVNEKVIDKWYWEADF